RRRVPDLSRNGAKLRFSRRQDEFGAQSTERCGAQLETPGIKMREIVHDRQAESGARLALVKPASALAQYLLPRRGRQARTVVIDEDAKEMPPVLLAARLADFDLHARRGPFAGVVDQIADHFLKVLLL